MVFFRDRVSLKHTLPSDDSSRFTVFFPPLDSFRFYRLAALVTAPPVVFLLRRRRKTVTVDL